MTAFPAYAVADLHGRLDLLEGALAAVPGAHLVVLGDVIDRGPDSLACVRLLLELHGAGRVTLLWGNHEHMLASALMYWQMFLQDGLAKHARLADSHFGWWLDNGGEAVRAEAGGFDLSGVPSELVVYLSHLKLCAFADEGGVHAEQPAGPCVLASHAAPPAAHPDYPDPFVAALWLRPDSGPFALPQGASWSVHGHTPLRAPLRRPPQVFTDLGAVATGRLCLTPLLPAGPGELLVVQRPARARRPRLSALAGEVLPYRLVGEAARQT